MLKRGDLIRRRMSDIEAKAPPEPDLISFRIVPYAQGWVVEKVLEWSDRRWLKKMYLIPFGASAVWAAGPTWNSMPEGCVWGSLLEASTALTISIAPEG